MRTQSNTKPAAGFEIERHGENAEIIFYCDIHEEENGFSYKEYRLKVPGRDNLAESVEKNYDSWLALAKEKESSEEPMSVNQKVEKLEQENEMVSTALAELIITVMGGE